LLNGKEVTSTSTIFSFCLSVSGLGLFLFFFYFFWFLLFPLFVALSRLRTVRMGWVRRYDFLEQTARFRISSGWRNENIGSLFFFRQSWKWSFFFNMFVNLLFIINHHGYDISKRIINIIRSNYYTYRCQHLLPYIILHKYNSLTKIVHYTRYWRSSLIFLLLTSAFLFTIFSFGALLAISNLP
jgi:hypothetical protein